MLGAILAIGSTLLSAGSKIAQHNADKEAAAQNRRSALAAMGGQLRDLDARRQEEIIASSQETNLLTNQRTAAEGSLAASAASNNVSGATVDALSAEMYGQEFGARQALDANLTSALRMLDRQSAAVAQQAGDRIDAVQEPSKLGLGLGIASDLLSLGTQAYKMKAPSAGKP